METVIVYYMPPDKLGAYEKYEMQRIDYNEAKAGPEGKYWSLEPPPSDAKIDDKVPLKLNIAEQVEVQAAAPVAPPVMKRRQPGLNPI